MKVLVAGAIVLAAGVWVGGSCLEDGGGGAPDERLASRLDDLCKIARKNIETPERGVKKLGHYLGKHAEDMLGAFGATISTIERIADDEKHDKRARVARDRIQGPLRRCERDWNRFAQAVEADPAASALVQRAGDRLGRTFEIIFSGGPASLRDLPLRLEARVLDLEAP